MTKAIIRTDKWTLTTNQTERAHLARTIGMYRAFVRALIGVVYVHWPDIARAESPCQAVECLIHATKQNPHPTYRYFDRKFYKFPSYLRRAAIEFAIGQVSSFVTRSAGWQSGKRTRPDARPPRLNADTGVYPVLYVGQCIGFCHGQYRKARHLNEEIAQRVSTRIIRFALAFGVTVIVFEYLKGWRPRGGKHGSTLRQRFHGWLHRRIVQLVTEKWEERGGQVAFVPAGDTSSQAFDGSGRVIRDTHKSSLARFSNGKRYHAGLSASQNIGARYWAPVLKLRRGNDPQTCSGKSSRQIPRMPVTLSTLWVHNACTDAEREAPVTPAQAG
jgi:IS605 OrfB family transposase